MKKNTPLLAYFGHHKSGSTWVETIVKNVCEQINYTVKVASTPKLFDYDIANAIEHEWFDCICYTNADINYVSPVLQDIRGFHVVRDPRDIVVSAYFSHLHSHPTKNWPELIEYREKLKTLSKSEGLLYVMEYLDEMQVNGASLKTFSQMATWDYDLPNVMEVKFETLTRNPYGTFLEILDFLKILSDEKFLSLSSFASFLAGESLTRVGRRLNICEKKVAFNTKLYPWQALNVVFENDFSRYAKGRKPGQEDVKSHNRKGVPGDWKNHFEEEHRTHFKERYGSLLVKLGYEQDTNW